MKNLKLKFRSLVVILASLLAGACESFTESELPDYKISSQAVFSNDETASSAMQGVFNELFRAYFSGGGRTSVTVMAGLSGNNLQAETMDNTLLEFDQYEVSPSNSANQNIWSSAYNMIYMVNSILEGVGQSETISLPKKDELIGEALFVRAFCYFYLTNLYGDVPLILSTDYRENAIASRVNSNRVYDQINEDLEIASSLLKKNYKNSDRSYPNLFAVRALQARVQLFLENWQKAADYSGSVIVESDLYNLPDNLDEVFLPNSPEAIWQISPIGSSSGAVHTNEGNFFIIDDNSSYSVAVTLTKELLRQFEAGDKRFQNWINSYIKSNDTLYFPFKYKVQYANSGSIPEYSMVLRLAEQYLIHAEASAKLGKIEQAIASLDAVRNRAELLPLSELTPGITKEALLDSIEVEKRRELFTEWGNRWLELKRLGQADQALQEYENWEPTDVFYPIPEQDLMKDPNLTQNPGY